ncbi:unnamed protein product [Echinostoma caproni]|uniref:Uncharacterized protein n=1 Tax=Echinostoma caproni TaxID=27848 RepID=A0A3P8GY01_9TREM|nr:unnamed protein product [Echinostoma caproni]
MRLAALKSAGELLRSAQAMPTTHPLYADLEKAVVERIRNFANSQAFLPPGQRTSRSAGDLSSSTNGSNPSTGWSGPAVSGQTNGQDGSDDWQVIALDGDMIIYKREVETEDGVVLDPLQCPESNGPLSVREAVYHLWVALPTNSITSIHCNIN